ncbi:MAG: lamin tail domain-containing protein [Thermoanaerobaculia bacterium]|nr:lamin tail domain-containing protein [Thermoanaerobaculia bacterium]
MINEVDYAQNGTDAEEFIEIYNPTAGPVNLDSYAIELVDGAGGGATVYQTIELGNVTLAAGDFYVVCADAAMVPFCDLDVSPDTDLIQDGAPDAVALTFLGNVIDTVSYDGSTGAPYTEGSGAGLIDDPANDFSASRAPATASTPIKTTSTSPGAATPRVSPT